ncbi:MAG: branched-chain amino acid ABC transporter permease [Frankiales bacterium]|nr:branched-chain amino acid ABC transporter permease [Frankiales bacterium]
MWLFYTFALPNTSEGVQTFFREWLPLNSVNEALVWVICAVGLNIVVGYAGLLDLGFVAFWAIGGYTAGWIMSTFFNQITNGFYFLSAAPPNQPGIHINWWIVLVVAGCVCALAGIIIGAPTLRLKSDYLALVTLGFGEIIPQVFLNGDDINGFNFTNGALGIAPLDNVAPLPFGPAEITIGNANIAISRPLGPFDTTAKFVLFSIVTAFAVFVSLRIREGRLGRAWLAIREDELAASMMGVPLMRSKLAAYAVGAFMGGLGGVVYAVHNNSVFPDRFNFSISIILLAMVVLGGMGNVWGVMIGALLLAWFNSTGLPQFGDSFNAQFGTDINFPSFNYLIFGSILVLMMLFRREGMFPETRTRQVLQEAERSDDEELDGGEV